MIGARTNGARQHLPIGRSAAGVPRTYRMLAVKRSVVHTFLARAASDCGSVLNSIMVVVGDKLGLYKTGQYGVEAEDDCHAR